MKVIGNSDDWNELAEIEAEILDRANGHIVLFHIEGPMSFGSAKGIVQRLTAEGKQDVPFIDSTASMAIEEVILKHKTIMIMLFYVPCVHR